jgi:uncharacterized membrane protein (DUF485 family)
MPLQESIPAVEFHQHHFIKKSTRNLSMASMASLVYCTEFIALINFVLPYLAAESASTVVNLLSNEADK